MKGMSLKDEGEITKLAKEKKKIWSELKAFCSSQVLEEAKASIFHELTDQGKEALSDVSPENEVSRISILLFRFKICHVATGDIWLVKLICFSLDFCHHFISDS